MMNEKASRFIYAPFLVTLCYVILSEATLAPGASADEHLYRCNQDFIIGVETLRSQQPLPQGDMRPVWQFPCLLFQYDNYHQFCEK